MDVNAQQVLKSMVVKYPELEVCANDLQHAFMLLKNAYLDRKKLLLCGNGGSASDCEHIVGELMKGFMTRRPVPSMVRYKLAKTFPESADYLADHLQGALPAISLVSHTSLITAYSNDVAADM